jgi:Peptidase family M23
VLLLIAVVLALPSTASARTWRWPAEGQVVQHFAYEQRDPFAKGQHRGIEIAAARGTRVRAACAGDVRFAGTVPRHGRTVSVTCGPFVATYLHLSSMAVRRGQRLAPGQHLGNATARLHFGIRRRADRFAYVDPLSLLPADPLGPAPPPLAAGPRRRVRPTAPPSMPARIPAAIWAGLALLALAVPTLTIARGRARARQAAERREAEERLAAPTPA